MIWYSLIVPMVNERFKTAALYWTHLGNFPLFTCYYCCFIFLSFFQCFLDRVHPYRLLFFCRRGRGAGGMIKSVVSLLMESYAVNMQHFNGNLYSSVFTCSWKIPFGIHKEKLKLCRKEYMYKWSTQFNCLRAQRNNLLNNIPAPPHFFFINTFKRSFNSTLMPPEDNARDADIDTHDHLLFYRSILCWKQNLVLLSMHKMFLVELWRNITQTSSESVKQNNFFGDFCRDSFKTWKSRPYISSVNHVLPCHLLQQTVTGNSLLNTVANNSLGKHPFLLALRRWGRHQYGISAAESQTFLLAKRPRRRRARRNGCFRRLSQITNLGHYCW